MLVIVVVVSGKKKTVSSLKHCKEINIISRCLSFIDDQFVLTPFFNTPTFTYYWWEWIHKEGRTFILGMLPSSSVLVVLHSLDSFPYVLQMRVFVLQFNIWSWHANAIMLVDDVMFYEKTRVLFLTFSWRAQSCLGKYGFSIDLNVFWKIRIIFKKGNQFLWPKLIK